MSVLGTLVFITSALNSAWHIVGMHEYCANEWIHIQMCV